MKRYLVRALGILALAAATVLLAVSVWELFGTTDEIGSKKRIVLLTPSNPDAFWDQVAAGVTEQLKNTTSVQMVRISEADVAEQTKRFEMALAAQTDGMIVHLSDNDALERLTKEAQILGIPVVVVNEDGADNCCGYAGSDNYRIGQLAAELLAEATGGSANIAVVAGVEKQGDQIARIDGFQNTLESYPDMHLVSISYSGMDSIQASEITQYLLKANPEIDAFFGVTSDDLEGIARTIDTRINADAYCLVGVDSTPRIQSWIESGRIYAVIQQNPMEMGQQAAQLLQILLTQDLDGTEQHFLSDVQILSNGRSDLVLPEQAGGTP